MDKHAILKKRFEKLKKHFSTLTDYKDLIEKLSQKKNLLDETVFNQLLPQEKAILDAYLQRFGTTQDFLGAKIFPLLMELAGFPIQTMSDVLYYAEKERLISNLEEWVELREIRNELTHDYPEDLKTALKDMMFCIQQYTRIQAYYNNTLQFAAKFQVFS